MGCEQDVLGKMSEALGRSHFDSPGGIWASAQYNLATVVFANVTAANSGGQEATIGDLKPEITGILRTAYTQCLAALKFDRISSKPQAIDYTNYPERAAADRARITAVHKNSHRVHFLAKSVQLVNDVKTALNPENPEAYNEDHLQTLVDNFVLAMKGGKLTEYKEGEQADVPLALNPKPLVGYNTQMNQVYDRTNITDGNRVWSIENAVNKLENALMEQIEASQ